MDYETKDSGKREEYNSGMIRDTQDGKPRFDLIYVPMLVRWAKLMARGAVKYGERNWEKACTTAEWLRFKGSAFRHFIQWFLDEQDEDHAAAIFFNISAAEYVKEKLETQNTVFMPPSIKIDIPHVVKDCPVCRKNAEIDAEICKILNGGEGC